MKALIGSTGVVGTALQSQIAIDQFFNRATIETMNGHYELVICAAPSGSRILVNADSAADQQAIVQIQTQLKKCNINKLILISTVDACCYYNFPYGFNRKNFETWCKQNYSNFHVIRLGSLIGANITKNILYDLRHQTWLDKINFDSRLQWTCLNDLGTAIDYAITHNLSEINLISEPIENRQIIERWAPELKSTASSVPQHYDIKPYWYSKQKIFDAMEKYFQ